MELYCIYQKKKGPVDKPGKVTDMIDMEKINYAEEAENWITNEGPMDMADILVDVLESDAFDGNSYYDKLYYADNLARELRKYSE